MGNFKRSNGDYIDIYDGDLKIGDAAYSPALDDLIERVINTDNDLIWINKQKFIQNRIGYEYYRVKSIKTALEAKIDEFESLGFYINVKPYIDNEFNVRFRSKVRIVVDLKLEDIISIDEIVKSIDGYNMAIEFIEGIIKNDKQ